MTDLPYFAWNKTEAERIQTEIRKSSRSSDAESTQQPEEPSQSGANPASHDA